MAVFQHPFTCIIAGPTQCGKTTFVRNLIDECQTLIHPKPDLITYCYSRFQDGYNNFSKDTQIVFKEGFPNIDDFDSTKVNLLIIDDLMEQCEKDKSILNLFTVDSHHKNISVIFISQNIFSKEKIYAYNEHKFSLFSNI